MKSNIFFAISFFVIVFVDAKAQSYNASIIPDSLTKDANAVKREEEVRITIKNIDKAIIQHKYAFTVLNEAGAKYGVYSNDYDKQRSLSDIDGNLYDAMGKKLKNVKKK